MTLESFESSPTPFAIDERPVFECAPPGAVAAEQDIRIRARRPFSASRDELFAAWTDRTAWESWLRLRARSRAILAPYTNGVFRLELGEGPRIHVITGIVREVRAHEFVSFTWIHHGISDQVSVLEVTFGNRRGPSELQLVHRSIASRREAAWLMRLWSSALDRLARHFAGDATSGDRVRGLGPRIAPPIEPERCGGGIASAIVSRCASSAA